MKGWGISEEEEEVWEDSQWREFGVNGRRRKGGESERPDSRRNRKERTVVILFGKLHQYYLSPK